VADRPRAAWGSFLAGLGSVVSLPVAVYLTRFSDTYELIHAGLAIPLAALLGVVAIAIARRSRRSGAVSLAAARERSRLVTAGRVLGTVGLCMAASAVVALAVYGVLEYVGSRD
jgi:hypothetical protein